MPNLSIQSTLPVWDDQATDPLPTLRGEQHAAVCVVGLGGSGLAALTRLREAGVDAVGVDAGQVGAGAAGRNGGFLLAGIADFHHHAVRRHGRERAAALYRLTLEELEHWYAAAQPGVRACGTLRIAADAAERRDCAAQQAALRADGLPFVFRSFRLTDRLADMAAVDAVEAGGPARPVPGFTVRAETDVSPLNLDVMTYDN